MTDSVLFIGVGNMGRPMALNVLAAGVPLTVADVVEASLAPFKEKGIPTAAHGRDLPGDVVITMLPTDAHVREALLGPNGALHTPRKAVIDMTSGAPTATKAIAAEVEARGVSFMDAPVSGGTPGAAAGTLTTMVGGDAAVLETYRPLLAHMCSNIRHCGPVGAGDTMKALNNFLSGMALWATCEALLVGAKAGLDPQLMLDTWKTSTGRNQSVEFKVPKHIMSGKFDAGFTMALIAKDIGIAAKLARELDIPAPMIAASAGNWMTAKYALGDGADFTRVLNLLEGWAGYDLPREKPAEA